MNVFEQQRTTTTYNASLQPETALEEGWLSQGGDERCTRTSYANNVARNMLTFPSEVVTVAGGCSSTSELSHSQTYYDNLATLGAAPSRGNPTSQRAKVDATTWVTTVETTFDAYGRPLDVRDAAGLVTQTRHSATINGGFPTTTTVTNVVNGQAHSSTVTEWLPGRDSPLKVTDPNGNVTTYAYDSLGRTVAVRLPTEQPSGQPRSLEYTYLIDAEKDAVPIVQTRQLQSVDPNVFVDSWVIYDSLMRQRQTQTLSPASGKVIVTGTSYDTRGLVQDETAPQAVAGTPGRGRLATAYENKTRTEYDGLGRVSRQSWFNPESGSNPAWSSTTTYTHDTTTTTPPVGGQTRTQVDGLGRNVRVEEQYGPAWHATTYGYDLAGNLTSVTDPAGNTINYTYNLAGWRLTIDDPDSGVWSYGYDTAGRQTRVIDARQQATHTTYDVFGRPTERRLDSPTGGLVARWSYDAAGEKGLLDTSVRVTPEGEWVVDVAGYDSRGRALGTTWTVPAGVPGLSGDYSVRYAYDRGDHQTSVEHPAVGGLPAETVTTRYNSLGVPEYLAGAEEYVWSASYDDQARPRQLGFGPRPNGQTWLAQQISYDANQRVSRSVNATTTGSISDHQFTYDQVGNITERTTQLGSDSWRECFGYDDRQRLETAYTVVATATCADGTAGTGGQPYDHEYQYSADGNLLRRTQDGATDIYSYPTGAGADRPHAPTAVDDDTYHWDANGNLQSRTVDGRTEQLAWDRERRLASASGPDGTSSFLYGAGGARLLRTTPNERTFYFAGHEVTASSDGATVRAVRTYTFADGVVATRSPSGVDYAITDQQGSVEGTVASGGGLEARRAYNPYGSHRHTSGETDSDQAWIGQIRDETTDLAYLNARYYDPNIGRFISPDPLYDTARPQTINPYTYAASNPSTVSDPSGAYFPVGDGCRCGYDARFSAHTNNNNIARATRRQGESLQGAIHRVESKYLADKSQHERNVYVLQGMARANRNPGFWRALASAGSGEALALTGMRIGNPEPGFWEFMHRVLQVCSHCNREEVIRKAMNIRNYRQIAVAQAKMGDTGYGKWPDPPKKEDCGLMPCFVGDAVDAIGGAASKAGDAAAWVYTHAEVSFTACAKWCIGVGVQGGHGYFQVGAGCCFVGVNGGFAAHEYEDRPCLYGTGGIPITSGGVGVYSDQIIGTNGRIDSSAGLSFGAGGGGAVLRNVDTGIGASPVC